MPDFYLQMNRLSSDGEDIAGMTRESWEASKNVSIQVHLTRYNCNSVSGKTVETAAERNLESLAALILMTVRFVIAPSPLNIFIYICIIKYLPLNCNNLINVFLWSISLVTYFIAAKDALRKALQYHEKSDQRLGCRR